MHTYSSINIDLDADIQMYVRMSVCTYVCMYHIGNFLFISKYICFSFGTHSRTYAYIYTCVCDPRWRLKSYDNAYVL